MSKPKNGKFVAYYRVSTMKQGQSGLGLDAQRQAVSSYMDGVCRADDNCRVVGEYVEIESGRKGQRPQLDAAIAHAKKEKATLVVAKLDRLYRNVHFVTKLMEDKIDFVCCDMPDANKLTIHILAAVAEHERELISERTKKALAALKERGVKLGTPDPQAGCHKGNATKQAEADKYAQNVAPIIREIQEAGCRSLRDIAKSLERRGIRTPRGGQNWHASQVSNVMARCGLKK